MAKALKWGRRIIGLLFFLFICLFWLAYCSPRPANMTDPAVLAGDGSKVDYCALPELDGSGLMAVDIPKGNTPGCAYEQFPMPILADCTEPLVDGAQDIRGLWKAVSGKIGHIERVEQCGARTVITTSGIIHDLGPNSTGGVGSNDTEGSVSFIAGRQRLLHAHLRQRGLAQWQARVQRLWLWSCRCSALSRPQRYDLGIYRRVYYANGADMHASARAKNTETKG